VRGPASRVNSLEKVMTETIWLTGHKESFTAANVAIDVSDPKVDLLEPSIRVEIQIGEARVEKTFSDVVVNSPNGGKVQPATTSVTLLGPTSLLDTLKAEELKITVDQAGLEPRLELPDALKGKIVLKSFQVSKFTPLK